MSDGNGNATGMTVKEMLAEHDNKLDRLDQRMDNLQLVLYLAVGLGVLDIVAPYLEPLTKVAAAATGQ